MIKIYIHFKSKKAKTRDKGGGIHQFARQL
mgnify:CR=1 FL=1